MCVPVGARGPLNAAIWPMTIWAALGNARANKMIAKVARTKEMSGMVQSS